MNPLELYMQLSHLDSLALENAKSSAELGCLNIPPLLATEEAYKAALTYVHELIGKSE